MISIQRDYIEDFEAVRVETGPLSLTLIPALGGKISSLRDARNRREWLWRNPRLDYDLISHGSMYADTGGWDECFPTVDRCRYPSEPWANATIQDHGELWSQQPEFAVEHDGEMLLLRTRWRGVALPYSFERVVRLAPESAVVRCEYTATNLSAQPMPVIWATHPLLAIEPGMRLVVPDDARFNATGVFPHHALAQRRDLSLPSGVEGGQWTVGGVHPINSSSDVLVLPEACGVALKLWSAPLAHGWAELQATDGTFQIRWSAGDLTQLALWLNLGAWSGVPGEPYYNLGLEPCIGAQDAVATAVQNENLFLTLPPNGEQRWWLEIELTTP